MRSTSTASRRDPAGAVVLRGDSISYVRLALSQIPLVITLAGIFSGLYLKLHDDTLTNRNSIQALQAEVARIRLDYVSRDYLEASARAPEQARANLEREVSELRQDLRSRAAK